VPWLRFGLIIVPLTLVGAACAELNQLSVLVQPPRFEQAADHAPEIRLLGPSRDLPTGGAGVRLWAHVTNPNAFGIRLSTLTGTLFLDQSRAATADFPVGLSLAPSGDTVMPLDLTMSFADLPGLADVVKQAASGQSVPYQLEGTIGVDAGQLGQPTFGPLTLLRGDIAPR
jgi:Late embryogenesis abundant protein